MGKYNEITFTAIPSHIPRQLAVDLLHNHSEIIQLNPLVISHEPIDAPQKAETDEYYDTWYEIHERIQYIPGTGKVGAGKISFNGVFHNLPVGLQTHIYAAAGVDLRHNYYIGGNQPGEPLEYRELGSQAPSSGLYLKEEVEIKCNKLMLSFVKKELRSATDVLISRLVKKAELVDAGILHAMMVDGKLKTTNPNNRNSTIAAPSPPEQSSEFSQSNRSSTFTESQDSSVNKRSSQPGPASSTQQGQFQLSGNISLNPVKLPTESHVSRNSEPTELTEQRRHQEVSGEPATTYHELPAEPAATSNEALSDRYYGLDGGAQAAAQRQSETS